MTTLTKILLIILAVLAVILSFMRFDGYKNDMADVLIAQQKARIEAKYQKDIKALNDQLAVKQVELNKSEQRVKEYRNKFKLADAKLRVITKPQTITETKQRLTAMKYEVLPATEVCLSQESAKQVVVDLEKGKVCEEKLLAAVYLNKELDNQIVTLADIVKLKEDQIRTDTEMIDSQKELVVEQEKVCEEKVKAAKPSIFDGIIKVLGGIGIGFVLALLL